VTAAFFRQLEWELRCLWRRPRTYVGFGAALLFQLMLFAALELPSVRGQFLRGAATLHEYLKLGEPFSALSNAVRVTGQTIVFIGGVSLALVAGDLVAKDAEDGTLRMVFCRPVSRTSVFLQKLLACTVYSVALTSFVGLSALLLAFAFEGTSGGLVVVSFREGILGAHEFAAGMQRYAASMPLLAASILTVPLLAFTLSCFPMKAATAASVAVLVLLGDWTIQSLPTFAPLSPYTLTTRIVSWRQVFNDAIPWLRLQRNYSELAVVDLLLVLVGWCAFCRRPLKPR